MRIHRVYVYVDGSDLEMVENDLLHSFQQFAAAWGHGTIAVINDRSARTPDLKPDDLPTWNLGLNLEFEKLPRPGIDKLLSFLGTLSKRTEREFVIGDWGPERHISEDWCFVGATEKPSHVEFLISRYSEI